MSLANIKEWADRITKCDPIKGPEVDLNDALYGADVVAGVLDVLELPQTPQLVRDYMYMVLENLP